jgi:putative membrane protein
MSISLTKDDKKARIIIIVLSLIVFAAVAVLGRYKLDIPLGFDEHIFAKANAVINTIVAILLVAGLVNAKRGNYTTHRNIMLTAIVLSGLFLISYMCHHLLAGEARFGDSNHDGILSGAEKAAAGSIRYIYYIILSTHIILASVILPFILFTAYRALIGEYAKHRKLARITWPIWFYVALTGPVIYWMISPYY